MVGAMTPQAGILLPVATSARYVALALTPAAEPRAILDRLRALRVDDSIVIGIGEPFVRAVGATVPGLKTFPALSGVGCEVPSTQAALWIHTRARDPGDSLHAIRRALAAIGAGVRIEEDIVAYKHDTGRDLSGFEDGTANPHDQAAVTAAITSDGGSFVAAQRWIHDLARLESFSARDRDRLVGRDLASNAELADAPATAHVKRAEQESFDPPAFMVRRSMPYGGVVEHGLYFVSYVAALHAFERMMRRMVGLDDGLVDGLFQFTRPISGGYYWCPPVSGAHLDLRSITL
jgi:putative iron-dependent peroxidase